MAIINGWGRGTWGEGAWGEALSVTLTAPSAATSALGTATTKTDNRFEPQNFNAVASVGSLTFNCKANVTITGVAATGEVGSPFKWQEVDDDQTPNWTEVAA